MSLKNMAKANLLLAEADETIGQRAADRDVEQERSMADIVRIFNILCGTNLTEAQGWAFMTVLKLKRSMVGENYRQDDYVDMAAYSALYGEARFNQSEAKRLTSE